MLFQLPPNPKIDHVKRLLADSVPESLIIDYKREGYGTDPKANREIAQDVCSFANAMGGHIVVGLDESTNTLPGIENAPKERERIVSVLRSTLDPLVTFDISLLEGETGAVLVLHIPRSPFGPHMVTYEKANKFYKRVGATNQLMGVEEIREHCLRTEMLRVKLEDFIDRQWADANEPISDISLYISVTPVSLEDEAIDVSNQAIRQSMSQLSIPMLNDTREPWNLGNVRPCLEGIETDNYRDSGTLRVFRNGHVDYHFNCDEYDFRLVNVRVDDGYEERKAFYAEKLILKVCGAIRVAKAVHEFSQLNAPVVVQLGIFNAKPTALGRQYVFRDPDTWKHYQGKKNDVRVRIQFESDWQAGPVSKDVLNRLWTAYNFEGCPFVNSDGVQFPAKDLR